ncbi:MAG: Fic family protein [Alphaproteobacteria bacterium]
MISEHNLQLIRQKLPTGSEKVVGYGWLIQRYSLKVPLPRQIFCIGEKHQIYETLTFKMYTPRHRPEETLVGHLTFALKYEGVSLIILKKLFETISPAEIEKWVQAESVGKYARRTWFLYEWLMNKTLKISNAVTGNFIDALNTKLQYGGLSRPSRRHRVNNNLPGVFDFCPLIWKTKKLETFLSLNLEKAAQKQIDHISSELLTRAAAFLLLKDSKASFSIEGETLLKTRAERWGRAVAQAGSASLSLSEIVRLQTLVIEDKRFIPLGLRTQEGFIGMHDLETGIPLPDHISARWKDIPNLMKGLIETYELLKKSNFEPVLAAAAISFGFVFIHPFVDGNGRIHRYLMHQVLADFGFSPKGVVFPISAVILENLEEYRHVLEVYSKPCLDFIEWKSDKQKNVEILNDTVDLYRYFDATSVAEFLYECIAETIQTNLPEEIKYLEQYDQFKKRLQKKFSMPDSFVDLLVRFLQQNNGSFSKRAQNKEFKILSLTEQAEIQTIYAAVFKRK